MTLLMSERFRIPWTFQKTIPQLAELLFFTEVLLKVDWVTLYCYLSELVLGSCVVFGRFKKGSVFIRLEDFM